MATKVKGSPPTKDKRGTSPSQQPAQQKSLIQRGKSPITPKLQTTSPSPATAKRSNSTSPSGRNVPNYLKPTRSSVPESSPNPVKKVHPSNETGLKPVMSRRKSLDKPLPPSHVPKTRVSAITKSQIPSSPSSARANASSSSKPLMGRIGKARSFGAEKESRVLHHVKKFENEPTKGLSTKETINEIVVNDNIAHIDDTPQIEAIVEKVEDFDRVNEDHKDNDDIEREVIVLEDNNIVEPEIEVEEGKIEESSNTPKDKNENFDPIVNETPTPNEEQQGEHKPHATYTEELSVPDQDIENANEEKEVEEEEEEEEAEAEEEGKTEVEVEANEEKEEVVEGRHEEEIKESETQLKDDGDDKKVDNKNENGGVKKVQVVQGKREMSVVSNDVIEETATKLREQRVNRVKALAGAFETVISNQ